MSLIPPSLTKGETVSKSLNTVIVPVLTGTAVGVLQNVVETRGTVVMGKSLGTILPIIVIAGGTAGVIMAKSNSIRVLAANAAVSAAAILGYKTIGPKVTALITPHARSSPQARVVQNYSGVAPSGVLGFNPNNFYG